MAFEIKLENTMGNIITINAKMTAKQQNPYIFLLTSGPTIWLNIVKGLRLKDILPVGGGKNGELFGSVLASPTFYCSALETS